MVRPHRTTLLHAYRVVSSELLRPLLYKKKFNSYLHEQQLYNSQNRTVLKICGLSIGMCSFSFASFSNIIVNSVFGIKINGYRGLNFFQAMHNIMFFKGLVRELQQCSQL